MNLPLETNDCLLNTLLRRNFFHALTLLGSAIPVSCVCAQWQIHGQIQSDCAYQLFQENQNDQDVASADRTNPQWQLTNIFIDAQYPIKEKISAHMRLGKTTYQDPVLWDDRLFQDNDSEVCHILSAYANFKIGKNITLSTGKLPLKFMNPTRDNPLSMESDPALHALTAVNGYKVG